MTRRWRLRSAIFGLVAASAVSGVSGTASAWCRANVDTPPLGECVENSDAALLHWTRGCSHYAFHRDFFARTPRLGEDEIRADFESAFAAFREVDCGRLPFQVRQDSELAKSDAAEFNWDVENESLIAMRTAREWTTLEYDPQAIAVTLVFFDPDDGEIYDADMELNAGIGAFVRCDERCGAGEVDLFSTVMHEAGHYLGLGHSDVPGSTMEARTHFGDLNVRTLAPDDREGYCALDLPEPERDVNSIEVKCDTPVFPRFKTVHDEPAGGSASGCAAAPSARGPRGKALTAVLAALIALAGVRARRWKVAVRRPGAMG